MVGNESLEIPLVKTSDPGQVIGQKKPNNNNKDNLF